MSHELKRIITAYKSAQTEGKRCILATVVALDGSSYRRPGVRMLLIEGGASVGAVSGGCVEKEVLRQSVDVFDNEIPKIMIYDGRYRLGCEGILYILLELFQPQKSLLDAIENAFQHRDDIKIHSYFEKKATAHNALGSHFLINDKHFKLKIQQAATTGISQFKQNLKPCQRLIILGAEHDAVKLVNVAAQTGWEVIVVADSKEEKTLNDFPGAMRLVSVEPEFLEIPVDSETAMVIMTHSYAKDFRLLLALKEKTPAYLGLLGPLRRREKLFHELIEKHPDISPEFLDSIHGPAGLDIGAETPEEIAISIMAEILTVIRAKKVIQLKHKQGSIHEGE